MKLRGHVHNEFGKVTMVPASDLIMKPVTESLNREKAPREDVRNANGPLHEDDDEYSDDWIMPTGHGGLLQGI